MRETAKFVPSDTSGRKLIRVRANRPIAVPHSKRNARGTNQYRVKQHFLRSDTARYLVHILVLCAVAIALGIILGKLYFYQNNPKELLIPIPMGYITTKVYAQEAGHSAEMKAPTKSEIIFAHKHGDIIFRIWNLESTRGTAAKGYHRGCEARGLSNEFGYDVWDHFCFQSFEGSVDAIDAWFDSHLKNHSLSESLCIYNIGKDTEDCDYARHFMGL